MGRSKIVAQLEQTKRDEKKEAKKSKSSRKAPKVKDRNAKLESDKK